MKKQFMDASALLDWLGTLKSTHRVVAPVFRRGHVIFDTLGSPDEWRQDARLPKNPPKAVVFPQRREVGDESAEPTVLWGVRPCDVQGFGVLDGVFLQNPVDEVYRKRREVLVIVAFACAEEDATCFCARVGSHPADTSGTDIFVAPVKNGFVIESITEKGETLLAGAGKDATKAQVKEADDLVARMAARTQSVEPLPDHLVETFRDDVWAKVSQGCLGCGVCSFLCPTCHCFDIADERKEKVIFWDCCAFPDFSVMTSGENPRKKGESRMRNRILHKFDYLVRTIGRRGCVGCGRCVMNCPAGLDIVEMVRRVEEIMVKEGSN